MAYKASNANAAKRGDRYRSLSMQYASGTAPQPLQHICLQCNTHRSKSKFPHDQQRTGDYVRCKPCLRGERKALAKLKRCEQKSKPGKTSMAAAMRNNMTPAESHLWDVLRKLNAGGPLFFAQSVLYGYIADFCCFAHHLVIEVDGLSHFGREEYDANRDSQLRGKGYRTLRFTNEEVLNSRTAVITKIVEAL